MNDFLFEKYNDLLKDGYISQELYDKFDVKKGLRNNNGTGILVGLTKVSDVSGYYVSNGVKMPKKGNLYFRGYDISEVAEMSNGDFGYENTCFLLLFGHYPNEKESLEFKECLKAQYDLPNGFLENIILKNPSRSLMNHIMRCILSLYSFDEFPDNNKPYDLILKGISIIAKMPAIISYSLQAKTHYIDHDSLTIHYPKKEYSLAENILYMSRNDGKFTDLEAKTLDMCLTVHADHGGGNNSTFVGTVTSSTLTDIYSIICASMASLKGPRHGGANMAVLDMMNTIINDVGYNPSDEKLNNIISEILNKNYFDKSGLIYGIGHAIYTISDPRCEILREKAYKLSKEKNEEKFKLYERFEKLAVKALKKKIGKVVCANVDFYSGLIYEMLDLPRDLFIPIFASSRVVGWISHDIENLLYCNKIIRPATKYVGVGGENED